MKHTQHPSAVGPVAGLVLFLVLLFPPLPCLASAAAPEPRLAIAVASEGICLPPATSWWGTFYGFLERSLTDRARMIQLGVVGMIIALLIMMKK